MFPKPHEVKTLFLAAALSLDWYSYQSSSAAEGKYTVIQNEGKYRTKHGLFRQFQTVKTVSDWQDSWRLSWQLQLQSVSKSDYYSYPCSHQASHKLKKALLMKLLALWPLKGDQPTSQKRGCLDCSRFFVFKSGHFKTLHAAHCSRHLVNLSPHWILNISNSFYCPARGTIL